MYCSWSDNLEKYVAKLEKDGYDVHLPHRDTNQDSMGLVICTQKCMAIKNADEVHIFYSSKSTGTHFDIGAAFALQKTIKVIKNEKYEKFDKDGKYQKSFPLMLDEWQQYISKQ